MSETSLYRDKNLQIIFGVTLMAVLGVSSITPVFPTLMDELNITPGRIGLLITFFTLPGVFMAPVLGVLADRFGRKRILVPSLFLFAVAGAGCALVRDFNLLLVLRVFQGIGSASLGSLNTTIIGDLYGGPRRAEAMGINASVLSVGTAFYPAIGGALALVGWYYPFVLPLLALPVGVLVMTVLKSPEPKSQQGFKEYLSGTWSYLKNMKVLGLFTASIITFILLYGTVLTYFTLLLDERFNASSFTIGLIMTAGSLATAGVSSQLGKINRKFTLATIIQFAFCLYGISFIMIPIIPSLWLLLLPMAIVGIAHGGNIPSLHTAIAGLTPLEYRAAFMSINSMVLRLGQTIGPPLMALIFLGQGFDVTFYVSGAIAFLTAIVAVVYSQITKERRIKR